MLGQPRVTAEPVSEYEDDAARARREACLERLPEHLQAPEFRGVESFPIGEEEDIRALSDALRLPELFPFRFTVAVSALRPDSRFAVQRQGPGWEMVRLATPRTR
jgi:hypothetical protein